MRKVFTRIGFIITVFLIGIGMLTSCTDQQRARNFGGNITVDLPKGQKLIGATWKEDSLWYLTKPMVETDKAEVYTFKESSSFGISEGTVTIKETK